MKYIKDPGPGPAGGLILNPQLMDPTNFSEVWGLDGNFDTASSHTHNAVISTLSMLSTNFQLYEQSALLQENITKMEEFISTLSSTSDGSIEAEMSKYSMWVDATQMLALLEVHLRLGGTMRQRMGTLWQGDLKNQAIELATLRTGQRSAQRKMLRNFGEYVRVWLREHSYVISNRFEGSPIGGIKPSLLHMNRQGEYISTRQCFRNSMNGYKTILLHL